MNRKLIYVVIGIMLMAIAAGCGKSVESEEKVSVVKTQKIELGNDSSTAEYAGYVAGRYETSLAFQVGGRIISRNVEAGSVVKQGEVLMQIDSRDVVQGVNTGAAQVEAAQAQLNLAETNMNRYRQLYEQDAVSAAVYDQYKTSYEAALASVKQAQAQYAQSTNSLGYTELIAPADGVISKINVEAGQVVAAGQAALVLVQDGEREIEINVPENKITGLKNQPQARVSFWALKDSAVDAMVREVSPVADNIARTYKVRLTLVNPTADIKLGMTAKASFKENGGTAVKVPLSAIYQTGDTAEVWVIADGRAHKKAVKIKDIGDNAVYVVNGLNSGDMLITAGVHKLAEGQAVKPMDGDM